LQLIFVIVVSTFTFACTNIFHASQFLQKFLIMMNIIQIISDTKRKRLEEINSDFKKIILPRVLSKLSQISITVDELRFLYFGNEAISKKTMANYAEFFGDEAFYQGIIETADIQIKSGHSSTYLYKLSYENESSVVKKIKGITFPGRYCLK